VRNSVALAISLLSFTAWYACAASEAPSFATGFEALNALAPSVPTKDTPWQRVSEEVRLGGQFFNELSGKMKGNGWLIDTKENGKIEVVYFGQILSTETNPPSAAKSSGGGLLGKILGANKKETTESVADISKDARQIINAIGKLEAFDSVEDFTQSWNGNGAVAFGPMLLFATQLHQTGHPELADELAWALFKAAPSREAVVDAALDSMGNQLIQKATTRFFDSWDWQAYHDEMASLVGKFPRGWQTQPAAALVLDSLKLKLSGKPAPDPRSPGIKLDDKALDAISWMLEVPKADDSAPQIPAELAARLQQIPQEYHAQYLESMGLGSGSQRISAPNLWLLKKPDELKSLTDTTSPLIKLGTAALPVLASLTTDNYPTPYPNPRSYSSSHSYRESPMDRAIRIHSSMERPATRGDIARLLLLGTLPDSNGSLSSTDSETLREIAMEFHKSHHGKNWGELAAVFLAEGSTYQKAEAAKLLATSTEAAHHKLFEDLILESSPAVINIASVTVYTQQRKAAAKPFLERYIALVRDEIGDGTNLENFRELPWEMRQAGSLNQTIKQLEAMVTGKSPQALAREIAGGTVEEARTAIPTFFKNYSSEKPQTQMAAMLAGAVAAESPEIRALFLSMTFRVGWNRDEGDEKSARKFSESEATAWKKLIADERPIPEGTIDSYYSFGSTLSELAACAAEYSLAPSEFDEVDTATHILGESLASLCLRRSKARLANEALPALPNAENVTDERFKEIVITTESKSSAEIIAYLDSLGPDERAAWYHWMMEEDPQDPPVPESVRKLRMTIVSEDKTRQYGMTPEPGLLGMKIGFEFHEDRLDAYLASLASEPAKHSLCFASISNANSPPGLSTWTMRESIVKEDDENEEEPFGEDSEMGYFFQSSAQLFKQETVPKNADALIQIFWDDTHSIWWVIDGKPVLSGVDDEGTIIENPESKLPAQIAAARESGEEIYIRMIVITRADAEKIAAMNDDE